MKTDNFFAELKRRNVYKIAVTYAVVAWVIIQAASILLPTFEVPLWGMKAVVATVAVGFPVALMLAWVIESTPEGILRTEDSTDTFDGPFYLVQFAEVQARVGNVDEAVKALRQLLDISAGLLVSPALLQLDPAWDSLRNDARFPKLCEEKPK